MSIYTIFRNGFLRFQAYRDKGEPELYLGEIETWTSAPYEKVLNALENFGFKKLEELQRTLSLPIDGKEIYAGACELEPKKNKFLKSYVFFKCVSSKETLIEDLHFLVDLYDEAVQTSEDVPFMYCKNYKKKMHEAVDQIDIEDIGIYTFSDFIGLYMDEPRS